TGVAARLRTAGAWRPRDFVAHSELGRVFLCILLYSTGIRSILVNIMALKTVTVRIPEEKVKKLDKAAKQQRRDRSFILNEAVDEYLSLQEYHLALIDEGIRQDEAGEVISHEEVMKRIRSLSKKKKI